MKQLILFCFFFLALNSCKTQEQETASVDVHAQSEHTESSSSDSNTKNDYWFNGKAEINSYKLSQARYGEMREGNAVLLFVTEPFSLRSFTKADNPTSEDFPVLKTIATKNFNTGIYPYSILTSSFFPYENGAQSIKVSNTSQEWCGHSYMELGNKKKGFEIDLNSYFEGESFENKTVEADILEDDIWAMIRLQPDHLPSGKKKVIPSFTYLRFSHIEVKAYECEINVEKGTNESIISLVYPELNRQLNITFENSFPNKILSWEETYTDGGKILTSSAVLVETIRLDYWNHNKNEDLKYREQLQLPVHPVINETEK